MFINISIDQLLRKLEDYDSSSPMNIQLRDRIREVLSSSNVYNAHIIHLLEQAKLGLVKMEKFEAAGELRDLIQKLKDQ